MSTKNKIKQILTNKPDGMSLKDIQQSLLSSGWLRAPSSMYINVYHTLRNNQDMFERIGWGFYKLNEQPGLKPDTDDYEELILSVFSRRGFRPCEICRKLQLKNIFISYSSVHYILNKSIFIEKNDNGLYYLT